MFSRKSAIWVSHRFSVISKHDMVNCDKRPIARCFHTLFCGGKPVTPVPSRSRSLAGKRFLGDISRGLGLDLSTYDDAWHGSPVKQSLADSRWSVSSLVFWDILGFAASCSLSGRRDGRTFSRCDFFHTVENRTSLTYSLHIQSSKFAFLRRS